MSQTLKSSNETGNRRVRFWRWIPVILLVLLLALPAFPPLINVALREGLKAVGFTGSWRSVSGYLLTNVTLKGAKLGGNGLRAEGEQIKVSYNLVRLFQRELPLRIQARNGFAELSWDDVIPKGPPAPPAPIRLLVDELLLDKVQVSLTEGKRFLIPNMLAKIRGKGPSYQAIVELPGGKVTGTVRRTGREFEAWEIDVIGDVRAANYWFEGLEGGTIQGKWTLNAKGILGKNEVKGGRVRILNFLLTDIYGPLVFDGRAVTANLVGRGLDGPVKASATVDLASKKPEYRFRVEGTPSLTGLLDSFNLKLPVTGSGPLVLEGRGWENLVLTGDYSGTGQLLGEDLQYQGTLKFDKIFTLNAVADGALFDRTFQAKVALQNQSYRVNLQDSFGSKLRLDGVAADTSGSGTLVLPKPLVGEAKANFASTGPRWKLGVNAPGLTLPLSKPFDLTGGLQGDAALVKGQLGKLGLSGSWDDLRLDLSALEMVVGSLSGRGSLKGGQVSADLNYDSPYTRFPIAVRQAKQAWKITNAYAEGLYQDNVFSLKVQNLPLQLGQDFKLRGNLRFEDGALDGGWNLASQNVTLNGELYDLATRFSGQVRTPLGNKPLSGRADASGLKANLDTLAITANADGLRLLGPLQLGFIQTQSDLTLKGSSYIGEVRFDTPYLSGVVEGQGGSLVANTDGYAQLSGPVWPTTLLRGRLTLPVSSEALKIPPLPLEVTRSEARLPGGRVEFKAGFPFSAKIPVLIQGQQGSLEAKGNIEAGGLKLTSQYGVVEGQGAWKNLSLSGLVKAAGYEGRLSGQADLFKQSYDLRLAIPELEGEVQAKGQLTTLTYAGQFQNGKLTLSGGYRLVADKPLEGLSLRTIASGYDLSSFGLGGGKLSGNWSEKGGRLRLDSPLGQVLARGDSLLGPVALEVQSSYGNLKGAAGLEEVNLRGDLKLPYLSGSIAVRGPWDKLDARGVGRYALPYLQDQPWRLRADVLQQTWKLEGPLELSGRGFEYQGKVRWPYEYSGRKAELSGSIQGQAIKVQADLQTTYAGIPLRVKAQADGVDLEKLKADLTLPEGKVQVSGKQASFDLETRVIAKVFQAEVSGRVSGTLDMEGKGEAKGNLLAYGEKVQLGYKDKVISALLAERKLGATLELDGPQPRLVGMGDLQGAVTVGERLEGNLSYSVPAANIRATILGTRERPRFVVSAKGDWGSLDGEGGYNLAQNRLSANLEVDTPYARGQFLATSSGAKYQAEGRLESLQYLKQSGLARLEGDGGRWSLAWSAPISVEAKGNLLNPEQVRLVGKGEVEAIERKFTLSGDLFLVKDVFSGRMTVSADQIGLTVSGDGNSLVARGEVYDALVNARVSRKGDLGGKLSYARDLYTNRLQASATLGGTIFKPVFEGAGNLAGKGAEIGLRFGYNGEVWAEAKGAGLEASYKNAVITLEASSDLEPFIGLPLKLETSGQGKWETLELPLTLSGPNLSATGKVIPSKQTAQIAGKYQQQAFKLNYDKVIQAAFTGPYVTGTARYVNGTPTGTLLLDIPIPGGRLGGTAFLDEGQVSLQGAEGWSGTLKATLAQGWSKPTDWRLETNLESNLGVKGAIKGQFDLKANPFSLTGAGVLDVPEWGQVQLAAKGREIELKGGEGIQPLVGTVQLNPLKVAWSYVGELPRSLGTLEARGNYPGTWIQGKYKNLGQTLNLEGKESQLSVSGEGLKALYKDNALEATLKGYALGPARLSGTVGGPLNALDLGLSWEAVGRSGQIKGSWKQNALSADLSGDLAGDLAYNQSWKGDLKFREGTLTIGGEGPIPTLQGSVLGLGVELKYPLLSIAAEAQAGRAQSGLQVNLSERSAVGEMDYRGLEFRGEGSKLQAVYPFVGGRLVGEVDLQSFEVGLSAPELGQGALKYSQGQLSGEMTIAAYGLDIALQGQRDRVALKATHPVVEWLPWKEGTLTGSVALDGAWQLDYADVERKQQIQAGGKLLDAALKAQGQWLGGDLAYDSGEWKGQLKVDLPINVLSSRLILNLTGKGELEAVGQVQGGLGKVDLSAALGKKGPRAKASFKDLALQEVPLLNTRIPYLEGRASGQVEYDAGSASFNLQSPELKVQGDSVPLQTRASGSLEQGVFSAKLSFGRVQATELSDGKNGLGPGITTANVRLENGVLSGDASASAFPMHWLFAAWVGDLQGKAYWTGKASFNYNLSKPWSSKGVFVGEYLRFEGGGDELMGKAVLRFEQERLYFDQLNLSGKGTWRGEGYLGRTGSNLRLDLENTSFTPVLQVIPNLKPYTPEGSGTVRMASTGQAFELELQDFKFKLGPVRAETPRVRLRVAETATAEGKIKLTAPYPAEADLSGEGSLSEFTVKASGSANVPLLSPNEPFEASFTYPSYVLDARLKQQQARLNGTLFPKFVLALSGPVPLKYPQYFLQEGLVNTNLFLTFDKGVYQLNGSAEVLRAKLGLPEGQSEVTVNVPSGENTPPSNRIPFEFANVQIKAERGILVQESLAQGELAGVIYLNGEASNPFLSGEVVPVRGNFKLWDRDFTIRDRLPDEKSSVRFSPASGILPDITVIADTTVVDRANNERLTLNLTLKVAFVRQNNKVKAELEPSFVVKRSDGSTAAYSESQIYALLLLGRSDLSALPADIAQSGLQAVVQSFVLAQLQRELAKTLGLDQVLVEAPILSGGKIEETKFTIGKYLSPDFYFGYTVDLRGYQTIFGEYQQGDYRLRFTTNLSSTPRPEFSFGYSIRQINADLTLDIATGVVSGTQTDGVGVGLGLNFRFDCLLWCYR